MTHAPYPTAFTSWGPEEHVAIQRVLASGQFTQGEEVAALEQELAAYHGVKHAVCVNSGSSANLIATAALFHVADRPLKRGDRALVPALAWPTLYAPLVQHGLELVLADCDDTWNANTWPACYPRQEIAVVVGCSILGNPAQLEHWRSTAAQVGAHYVEDNCESLGARRLGFLTGTFGRMGTLSFFYSHQLSAIEGGAVITDDDECAELCRLVLNHGWKRGDTFETQYDFRLMGYNLRLTEMHAAIAREQLKRVDAFRATRMENLMSFRSMVRGLPVTWPLLDPEANPFGIAFALRDRGTRAKLAAAFKEAGIDSRPPVGGCITKHKYGERWTAQETPNAARLHDTGMMIGLAPFPMGELLERAAGVMRKVLA